ncbi:MAG: hypothetical protein K7J15_06370, partial [Candidatus Regiella insecticola]|nr:hypothetical protein ['Prunus persica' phytoplasma PP2]MCX2957307.1 hypothetical protein [Candidatus Regiella insecticola]
MIFHVRNFFFLFALIHSDIIIIIIIIIIFVVIKWKEHELNVDFNLKIRVTCMVTYHLHILCYDLFT